MKSGIITIFFIVSGLFFLNGCGESEYNKITTSPDISQEVSLNESITTYNENWQKMLLNAHGNILSTNQTTGETITKTLVSDEEGRTDSFDLSITIVELIDGTYSADGDIVILHDLTIDEQIGLYSFINILLTYEEETDVNGIPLGVLTRTYSLSGDSPVTSSGESAHSFNITIKREGYNNYTCLLEITDHGKNRLIEIDVNLLRVGGNGPEILYPGDDIDE